MVYGIGCDLCSLSHLEKSLSSAHAAVFARRVFGPAEQAALGLPLAEEEGTARRTAHTVASAAADFAAKEAFLKAAGTGLREPFSLCEIEAVRLPGGAPAYRFSGRSAQWVEARRLRAHLSLSEIEAVRLESGAPAYHFSGQTAEWMQAHGLAARRSLSHEGGMALAFCTLEEEN